MNGSFHVVRGIFGMAKSKVWVLVCDGKITPRAISKLQALSGLLCF